MRAVITVVGKDMVGILAKGFRNLCGKRCKHHRGNSIHSS